MQVSDLFFSKLVAFNVNVLRVRNLDLEYFVRLRAQAAAGRPLAAPKRIFGKLHPKTLFKPLLLIIPGLENESRQVVKVTYTITERNNKEPLMEATADFYLDQVVVLRETRFSVFRVRDDSFSNFDRVIESANEGFNLSVRFANNSGRSESFPFALQTFLRKESLLLKLPFEGSFKATNLICLLDKADPFGENEPSAVLSHLKGEKVGWRNLRPGVARKLAASLVPNENRFLLHGKSLPLLKSYFAACELAFSAQRGREAAGRPLRGAQRQRRARPEDVRARVRGQAGQLLAADRRVRGRQAGVPGPPCHCRTGARLRG